MLSIVKITGRWAHNNVKLHYKLMVMSLIVKPRNPVLSTCLIQAETGQVQLYPSSEVVSASRDQTCSQGVKTSASQARLTFAYLTPFGQFWLMLAGATSHIRQKYEKATC